VTHRIYEVTCCAEDRTSAPSNFSAGFSERGHALATRYQFRAKLMLELLDLHGQCGLTDCTFFCCPTETPMPSQRIQVSKLPKGKHIDNSPDGSI
jgi:hypothetical protein